MKSECNNMHGERIKNEDCLNAEQIRISELKYLKKIKHKPNRHIRSFLLLTLLHMLAQKAYISTSTCQCQQLPVCMQLLQTARLSAPQFQFLLITSL